MAKLNVGVVVVVVLSVLDLRVSVSAAYSGKVLLVSMDGFRWDYLQNVSGLDNFKRLAKQGVSVDYVNNTFVTKTFPCHYTIVTGLYQDSHGIIANRMYDRQRNASFSMQSREPFWWEGGEPIWVTAVKRGKKAATYFWPGSEAQIHGHRPTVYKAYNQSVPFQLRVDTALSWFTEQGMDFVALYFHEPDFTGHLYGPLSTQVADKVREMDSVLGLLLDKMEEKGLSDVVNLIVTSDHGMAEIDLQNKIIDMWSRVNKTMVGRVVDRGQVTAILPAQGQDNALVAALKTLNHVTVYRREEIPDHFHYKNNERIMPVIVISDEGWTLTDDVTAAQQKTDKGDHGYDNTLPSMKPIFLATGPNFRQDYHASTLRHIDIYPLVCELLGIQASANNGTLDNTKDFLQSSVSSGADRVVWPWALMACSFGLASFFVK